MPECTRCHRDVATGALFCPGCGTPVVAAGSEPADPYIGQTFRGTYFVQQKVGAGGMGQVYKAMHVTLDVPVALKILRKALLADPAIVQRFYREARAASRLRHPNVISVTDFGQLDDGTLFMAMEFVAGKSLARIIAEEFPLSEQRVVRIASQILAALAEAHAAQILHRDLKPENVMVESRRDERDAVKVLDFGIAKIQQPGDGQGTTLTQQGLVCGTPGYMSPEQWAGEPLDARSDLYAVGVILYEMLTGKMPHEGQTPMEVMRRQRDERPLPPSERRPDGQVSPDLEALVLRCLSPSREDRPESAESLRDELNACLLLPEPDPAVPITGAGKTAVFSPPGGTRPSPPPSRRGTTGPGEKLAPTEPRTPGSTRPSPPPVATHGTAETQVRPGTPSPSRSASPPRGATRRPPPATARPTSGPLRHEEDEPEGDESPLPPPPVARRNLLPFAVGGGVLLLAVVGAIAFVATGKKESPAPPPAVSRPEPPPVRAPEPALPPAVVTPSDPPSGLASADPGRDAPRDADPRAAATGGPPAGEGGRAQPTGDRPTPRKTPRPDSSHSGTASRAADPAPTGRAPFMVRDTLNSIPIPAASTGDGILSVAAEPFGNVWLDGKLYGEAPQEFRVGAGTHLVRVVHPTLGAKEKRVTVVAGRRTPWTANFE